MRIRDLLAESSIALHGSAKDKKDVIDQMVKLMAKNGNITDVEAYKNLVLAREEESTTAVGEGVAIPHGKGSCVARPGLAAMVLDNGVDYDSPDGDPVRIVFLIAAPNTKDNVHVDVLSKLSVLLLDENFTKSLLAAKSVSEFLNAVDAAENAKDAADAKKNNTTELPAVLAVTACPTGIAHTYMAEESLKKAAKKLGVTIKVETRGTTGAKNVLTEEEINSAKAIIVAADTQVPMARFAGKKVIECRVAEGINNAEKLIH